MLEIMQATTPTLRFRLSGDIDLDELNVFFTLTQGSLILEKHNDAMAYEDGILYVHLTQTDTIKFKPGMAKLQLNITAEEGEERGGTYEEDVKILNNQIKRFLQ